MSPSPKKYDGNVNISSLRKQKACMRQASLILKLFQWVDFCETREPHDSYLVTVSNTTTKGQLDKRIQRFRGSARGGLTTSERRNKAAGPALPGPVSCVLWGFWHRQILGRPTPARNRTHVMGKSLCVARATVFVQF